jgi:1-acyl-sn-glycerol-3-phosphate acyltransferase
VLARTARFIWFNLFIRPLVFFYLGVNIRRRNLLPKKGPAILVANHNSHLDTMLLMIACPSSLLEHLRPAAAGEYFLSTPARRWFSKNVLNIIPVWRNKEDRGENTDPLASIDQALDEGSAVIFFPEGSRGEPEQMTNFKRGIAILASRHPDVPIVPIFLQGAGRALPKGEGMVVPFLLDMFVGEHLYWGGDEAEFMDRLKRRFETLSREGYRPQWE